MRHTTLEVRRDDPGVSRLTEEDVELMPGDVRVRIDHFAITANNVTYAMFGDALGYWDFFPVDPDPDGVHFGRVPAMGWATVIESRAPDIALGRRFYGWYPFASHAVFTPQATGDGFRDDGVHRRAHAPVYRSYVDTSSDPMYDEAPDGEERHMLLRGLFLTGFLAEEFFGDSGGSGEVYYGTERVIVLSASSKTAIGFAQRAAARGAVEVVGVTSAGNRDFVESLGFYDRVVDYDAIDTLPTEGGAVSIDMAGNPTALAAVHSLYGDGLAYSMTVGRSHHDAPAASAEPLAGPAPELFFAPTAGGRLQELWGRREFERRSADALAAFVDGSRSWMRVDRRTGSESVEAAWTEVFDGAVTPDVGIVASHHASLPATDDPG